MSNTIYAALFFVGLGLLGYGLYELDRPAVTVIFGFVLAIVALATNPATNPPRK